MKRGVLNHKATFFLTGAIIAFVCACGNPYLGKRPSPTYKGSYAINSWDADEYLAEQSEAGEFTCPIAPNVKPLYDWDMDGSNRYEVCVSSVSTGNLLVRGEPSEAEKSGVICVFPLEYIDRTHVFIKPDMTTGWAMHRCVNASESGASVTFPAQNLSFNMVLIIESKDLDETKACLDPVRGVNFDNCPRYAYGRIR